MDFFVWLEQTPIGLWINNADSVYVYPIVLLFHTVGLAMVVSINIVVDLRVLGFAPQIPVGALRTLIPLMWTGLAINASTGLLLLTAKATQFVVNPAFYVKMLSIALAVATFLAVRRRAFGEPESGAPAADANVRALAFASMMLWLVALTAGRWMAYLGEATEFASQF
jgi:hypothetical protein